MIEQKSAKAIGSRGYSYWTGKPANKRHTFVFVPNFGGGGWGLYCSCGEYCAIDGMWEYRPRDEVHAGLNVAYAAHLVEALQGD